VPAFEFLFLNNRLFDVVGGFDIDESLRVELFREAVIQTLAVFPRAAGDVVCDADLERAVALVGQDVDVIGLLLYWTPDQVRGDIWVMDQNKKRAVQGNASLCRRGLRT
jgi:hypothetical protein